MDLNQINAATLVVPQDVLVNQRQGTNDTIARQEVLKMTRGGFAYNDTSFLVGPLPEGNRSGTWQCVFAPPDPITLVRASIGFNSTSPVTASQNASGFELVSGIDAEATYDIDIPSYDPTYVQRKEDDLWVVLGYTKFKTIAWTGSTNTLYFATRSEVVDPLDFNYILIIPLSQLFTSANEVIQDVVEPFPGYSLYSTNTVSPYNDKLRLYGFGSYI